MDVALFDGAGEKITEFFSGGIQAMATAAWHFIEDAFSVGTVSSTDGDGALSDWWVAIVGGEITQVSTNGETLSTVDHPGMLVVVTAVMIPVLLLLVGFQVIRSIQRQSTVGLVRAAVMSVFGIPGIWIMTGLMWTVMGATDWVTQKILSIGTSQNDGVVAVLSLFGLQWDESGANTADGEAGVVLNENFVQWEMAGADSDLGMAIWPFIVGFVLAGVGALLMAMMVFRTLALLILTVFLPVAVFSLAEESAKAVFNKWVQVVLALLIAKPVAAVIVRMGAVMAQSSSEWIMGMIGVVIMLLAAAAPLFCVGMVAFMTGGAADGIERQGVQMGQRGIQQSKQSVRSVTRAGSKMGAAGRAGGGGGPAGGGRATPKPVGGGGGGSAGSGGSGSGQAAGSGTGGSAAGKPARTAQPAMATSGGGSGSGSQAASANQGSGAREGSSSAPAGQSSGGSGGSGPGQAPAQAAQHQSQPQSRQPGAGSAKFGGAAASGSTSAQAPARE